MTVLEYMTKHRGYRVVGCTTVSASVLYRFQKSRTKVDIEVMPDSVLKVTVENETRIIPSPDVIKAALKEKMSDDAATIRMLSQVLDKLLRKHRGDVEADVQDAMSRHARQKM